MAGLLSDVLPYIYSRGNALKRQLGGLLSDPVGSAQQSLGLLQDQHREQERLDALAHADPRNPFRVTDGNALSTLVDRAMAGPMGFAPSGLTKAAKASIEAAADISPATRAERMGAMGMERGWYRGGPEITGTQRSGPWYTQDADEAANYAKRYGKASDVREYAIPKSGFLEANAGYSHKLPNDVAAILDDPYFGKSGADLARELRTYGPGEGIQGGQLWQALESRFGNDGAAEVLSRLGAFKGVKGVTGGPEALVFKSAPVRDANKAAFDPANLHKDDIYGNVTLPMLGLLAGGSLGAADLIRRGRLD